MGVGMGLKDISLQNNYRDSGAIEYEWFKGKCEDRLRNFLMEIDDVLIPCLSERVNILEYAYKLNRYANNIFVSYKGVDVAGCSIYCNASKAFISSFAVKPEFMKQKIGSFMMQRVEEMAICKGCESIRLEVFINNLPAINFYEKCGFWCVKKNGLWIVMERAL